MARILIFTYGRQVFASYEAAGVPVLAPYKDDLTKTLEAFSVDPNGQLVVASSYVSLGFRVPSDTFVVFDQSWKWPADHPYTIQAKGRAARAATQTPNASYDVHSKHGEGAANINWHAPFDSHGGHMNQSLDWLIDEAIHRGMEAYYIAGEGGSVLAKRKRLVKAIDQHVQQGYYAKQGSETATVSEDQKPQEV